MYNQEKPKSASFGKSEICSLVTQIRKKSKYKCIQIAFLFVTPEKTSQKPVCTQRFDLKGWRTQQGVLLRKQECRAKTWVYFTESNNKAHNRTEGSTNLLLRRQQCCTEAVVLHLENYVCFAWKNRNTLSKEQLWIKQEIFLFWSENIKFCKTWHRLYWARYKSREQILVCCCKHTPHHYLGISPWK